MLDTRGSTTSDARITPTPPRVARRTPAIDRVFVAGEFRDTTRTRKGRDVSVIAPLADDLLDMRASIAEDATASVDPEALVHASGRGTPVNPNNWRRRTFDPACEAAGMRWATAYSGGPN